MKKREQKGFTIVELVIVIAVIAVLATVLVPTFGDLIGRAQAAAATQQVANAYKEALVKALADNGIITEGEAIEVDPFTFIFTEGGQGAQILTKDFLYPQVCIVDGKVQLGPKKEDGGNVEESEASNPPDMPEPTIMSEPTIEVESITLEQPEPSLNVGEERSLSYTIAPAEAAKTKQIVWASSDESVATVENGKVRAVGVGKAIITASVDEQTASCEVDVTFGTKISDVSGLVSAWEQGISVSLEKDIPCGKNNFAITNFAGTDTVKLTLDLHGCELQNTGTITVDTGVELTILNGTISLAENFQVNNGGKLIIDNCTISSSGHYVIKNAGAVTILDSSVSQTKGDYAIAVGSSDGVATLTLIRTNVASVLAGIEVSNNGIVHITGGAIKSTYTKSDDYYAVAVVNQKGTVYFHADENGNNVIIMSKNTCPLTDIYFYFMGTLF